MKTEKEKLQEYYNALGSMYIDFTNYERDYIHGEKKKIRERAYDQLLSKLELFERYVDKNYDLYALITSNETNKVDGKVSDYSRNLNWQEFTSVNYFSRDMRDFLVRLKKIIDNFVEK